MMADKEGKPFRAKLRSPSYCIWPAVPFVAWEYHAGFSSEQQEFEFVLLRSGHVSEQNKR